MQRSLKPCICGRNKNVPATWDENGSACFTQGGEKDRTTHPGAHEFITIMRRHHHRDVNHPRGKREVEISPRHMCRAFLFESVRFPFFTEHGSQRLGTPQWGPNTSALWRKGQGHREVAVKKAKVILTNLSSDVSWLNKEKVQIVQSLF